MWSIGAPNAGRRHASLGAALRLVHLPETHGQAAAAAAWLVAQGMPQLSLVEQSATPTARELRLQPELTLICDQEGLWLAANGMKMQPNWLGELPRLQRAGAKTEVLARACLAAQSPRIIDATAGLGHDGLLLAWCGAEVTLVERHPILALLLQSAQQQALAAADPRLRLAAGRIRLVHAKSEDYLSAQITQRIEQITQHRATAQFTDQASIDHSGQGQTYQDSLESFATDAVDVVYLDPMFPKSPRDKKQPLVKKEMQILQLLLHSAAGDEADIDWGDALLPLAQQISARVIVKRPKLAQPLAGIEPDHRWVGEACRFDGYFQTFAQPQTISPSESD